MSALGVDSGVDGIVVPQHSESKATAPMPLPPTKQGIINHHLVPEQGLISGRGVHWRIPLDLRETKVKNSTQTRDE